MRHLTFTAAALACAALLAACGGSSGGSDPAPPTGGGTTTITLTGVVATGAAMANATVNAKCASGTGTATTVASGGYTLTITGGALPCVLSATSSDAARILHSVAPGSAGATSAVANITSLTELLVAHLTGKDPSAYMTGVNTTTLGTAVTAGTIATAQTAVLATLTAAGIDTSAIGNMVSGTLTAANGGTPGNGYDLVLDALGTALADGGTTLTELAATVASTSPASGNTTVAQSSPLPADLLLKPKAAHCAALRSTTYRILKVAPSVVPTDTAPFTAMEMMDFDAETLTATFGAETMAWQDGDRDCHFRSGDNDIVVSPSGVLVARNFVGLDDDTTSDGGKMRMLIGLPVQEFAVADLAANWNLLGWYANENGTQKIDSGIMALAANGSTVTKCFDDPLNTAEASCTSQTGPAFSANANGGFTITSTDSDPWTMRAFAFRAGTGDMMTILISPLGEMSIATKVRTLTLPTVGNTSTSWNIAINAGRVAADALSTTTNTITGVSGNNVTRDSRSGSNAFTTPQQLTYNFPRNGLWYRTGQPSVVNSDNSVGSVREGYFLRMPGIGMTIYALPNSLTLPSDNSRFGISVNQ